MSALPSLRNAMRNPTRPSRLIWNGKSHAWTRCCLSMIEEAERQTRYLMLVKVKGKDTETVVDALIKNARKLPQKLDKSLTWDRGKEDSGAQALHDGHRHPGLVL